MANKREEVFNKLLTRITTLEERRKIDHEVEEELKALKDLKYYLLVAFSTKPWYSTDDRILLTKAYTCVTNNAEHWHKYVKREVGLMHTLSVSAIESYNLSINTERYMRMYCLEWFNSLGPEKKTKIPKEITF